ncbi:hypothetical protein H9L13_03635 [Sphingomonas lutea]|uniref:Uncharacterized protein n=1 Tax=Sphingomonas lutea TaxID=1045317 RepID=A0A7G9SJI9_9SPHN|nr:hypothetical protein [Sphingomonas lutea]QNN68014.1 hypothetical protein H9L13_03635 [Sphingomonas lutea]
MIDVGEIGIGPEPAGHVRDHRFAPAVKRHGEAKNDRPLERAADQRKFLPKGSRQVADGLARARKNPAQAEAQEGEAEAPDEHRRRHRAREFEGDRAVAHRGEAQHEQRLQTEQPITDVPHAPRLPKVHGQRANA